MTESPTFCDCDNVMEGETSNTNMNAEFIDLDQYMHLQHLLPSRSSAMEEKYDTSHNLTSILPYATLRSRQSCRLPVEDHANAITNHLQLNHKLTQDDPTSQRLRIETLKAMPQCLTIKRSVKSKLQATVVHKSKAQTVDYRKWLQYRISYTYTKIHTMIRDTAPCLELWYDTIKLIEGHCGSGIATYFKFLRWLICLNIISCILSVSFIVIPQSFQQTHTNTNIEIYDFLTGSGFFSNSIMYYGFYSNETLEKTSGSTYSIPAACFMTLLCCYTLTLIVLSIKVATSYQKCYIEIRGNVQNMYSNKIFCGWDFSISSFKAASLHAASIYREFKELLVETEQHPPSSCLEKILAVTIQITVTIIIFTMICGVAMLLWILLDKHETDKYNTVSVMLVPMVVTIIMQIFPIVISWLALFEKYNNRRTRLYITMIRIHTLAATVIGTHTIFWLTNTRTDCWQTKLGEEIYRLVLLDFIVATLGKYLYEVVRLILHDTNWLTVEKPEFDIPHNTLNLMYNQTLFWLGFYFSPLISIIILLKMIFILYLKKYGVLKYYAAPQKPWRAAQTQTLFLALAFLSMIGVLIVLGYIITKIRSNDCGPFRGYDNTWDFVIDKIFSLEKDSRVWKIMLELTSPVMGAVILVAMCIGVYCLRAKVEASKEMLQILKEMLIVQSRDKEFLMKSLSPFDNERNKKEECATSSGRKHSINKHARIDGSPQTEEKMNRDILIMSASDSQEDLT